MSPQEWCSKSVICAVSLESEGKMGSTTCPHKQTFGLCVSLFPGTNDQVVVVVALTFIENHISKQGDLFIIILLWFAINLCFNAKSNNFMLYIIFILDMYC